MSTLKLAKPTLAAGKLANIKKVTAATVSRLAYRSTASILTTGLLLGAATVFAASSPVSAAACPTPVTDLGTLTLTVNIPATATYTIWSRLMVPDTANNMINLQVDATDCYNVGGTGLTANSWTWVNYHNASTSTFVRQSLSAGTHTFKYIGTKAGVSLDRIIATSDASCTPTGTGDNCQNGDSTAPTVNVTSPANGTTATGTVNITATASETVKQMQFLVDGTVVNTDTTSPYSFAWNSASVADGSHALSAKGTDNADNIGTSANVTVTVSNGGTPTPKQGDLNNDGKVNITDLSILLSNWAKTPVTAAQGDINADGKVNITDLSILLSKWG